MSDNASNMREEYKKVHHKSSADQVRNKLRQKFRNTLQEARQKSIDAKRFSNSSSTSNDIKSKRKINSVKDLREILLDNRELQQLISLEEIDKIFEEVEAEIGWNSNEQVNLYDAEIEAIVNSLLTVCMICDQTSSTIVCETCGNEHFTDSL